MFAHMTQHYLITIQLLKDKIQEYKILLTVLLFGIDLNQSIIAWVFIVCGKFEPLYYRHPPRIWPSPFNTFSEPSAFGMTFSDNIAPVKY